MTVAYSLGQESRTKWEKWPALPRYIRLKAQLLLSRTQQLYCLCSDVHVGQMYSCISRLRKLIALGNWTKKKILLTSTVQSLYSGLFFLFPGLCLLLTSQSPMSRIYDPEWKGGVKIPAFTLSFLQPVMLSWENFQMFKWFRNRFTLIYWLICKLGCFFLKSPASEMLYCSNISKNHTKENILSNSPKMFARTTHLKIVRQSRWQVALCDLFVFFL